MMTMAAAILCPGPSLSRHDPQIFDRYDTTIAVNRAIHYYAADVWSFGDIRMWRRYRPVWRPPLIWTRRDTLADISKAGYDLTGYQFKLIEDAATPNDNKWQLFTMMASMVYAAEDGATTIEIYGCDWTVDNADFDGHEDDVSDRTEDRWPREREIYERVVHDLTNQGVTVERIR